ncbi:heterokaryon incompatibility protein-domain-containing protein, partial [Trametes meyenii]
MWLLSTHRAEFKYFRSAEEVDGGYAILSHVWQDDEQSFEDLRALQELCSPGAAKRTHSRPSPRDLACAKIRECCRLAEADGYRWVWIDTCCIDKRSSAELSEAINAMFAWYAHAHVCYAYLHDVPLAHGRVARRDGDLAAPSSTFRTSVWFTRGWTLQELIAPRSVVFVSREWAHLGTKAAWAALLEEITGVDRDVLAFRRRLSSVGVAQRMAWAARRRTRRKEDEAYALMGIFGVHMPTVYGEGSRAFGRLQEEIMRLYPDQSLFAW